MLGGMQHIRGGGGYAYDFIRGHVVSPLPDDGRRCVDRVQNFDAVPQWYLRVRVRVRVRVRARRVAPATEG